MVKVTIVVPVYNVENWVGKCLESLVAQTLSDIRVLVIDDGSTDESGVIVDEYAKSYPELIEVYHRENAGLSDARNFGISLTDSKYIGFVDGDDPVEPDMFEKLFTAAEAKGADITVCDWYAADEETKEEKVIREGCYEDFADPGDRQRALSVTQPYAWSKLYKTELFKRHPEIRYPSGKVFEDIPVTFPLLFLAGTVTKVDEPLYRHIVRRRGAITSNYNEKILDMFLNLSEMIDFFEKKGVLEEYRDALCYISLRHIFARFMEFGRYHDTKLKQRVMNAGWALLDKRFPGWKKSNFFEVCFGKKGLKRSVVKSKLFWKVYSFYGKGAKKPKRSVWLKYLRRSEVNRCLYALFCKRNVDDKLVLFEAFHGREISDSSLALCKKLYAFGEYKICFTTEYGQKKAHRAILNSLGLKEVRLLPIKSVAYHKTLATAKYLINNVTFPAYFIRREGQIYLNTWHGTPLKTLGKSDRNGLRDMINSERNFLQATHLLFPNEYTKEKMFADYNLEKLFVGKSLTCGYPRNDVFFDKDEREKKREAYGLKDIKVYAYLPTWRGADTENRSQAEVNLEEMFWQIDRNLPNNTKLFVKLHQLASKQLSLEEYEHIAAFPENTDTYTFLNCVDVLITDYSSVAVDFAVSGREVVLFMYDHDNYMRERGFYVDPAKLPFKKAYDMNALLRIITEDSDEISEADRNSIEKEFLAYEKGNASERVIDAVFKGDCRNIDVREYGENGKKGKKLYVCTGIIGNNCLKKIKELEKSEDAVIVMRAEKFDNEEVLLLSETAAKTPWVIASPYMSLTFSESISFDRKKFKNTEKLEGCFEKELKRLLPGIEFTEAVALDDSFYSKGLVSAALKTKAEH